MQPPKLEPMIPQPFRVTGRRQETRDTFTLTLAPPEGGDGFTFSPGQFNMLYIFGVGEAPISISGDPAQTRTLTHTVRGVGGVSNAICRLRPGDFLGVRGPFGVPWPVAAAREHDLLVIAGGLGLAPLRPAIYQTLHHRQEYGNVEIIYGARTPQDLLYRKELERWRGRFDVRVHVTVDAAQADWRGNVGVVPNLIKRARFDPEHTVALICGPGIMMRFTIKELLQHGVSPANIFVSMERNMKCGLGLCGHCQLGPTFICKDGPVFSYEFLKDWFEAREV